MTYILRLSRHMYALERFNQLHLCTAKIKNALCGLWFCGFSLVDFDCWPGQHVALPDIHTRVWLGRLPQCQEPNFWKEGKWLKCSVPVIQPTLLQQSSSSSLFSLNVTRCSLGLRCLSSVLFWLQYYIITALFSSNILRWWSLHAKWYHN